MPNHDGGHYFLSVLAPIKCASFDHGGEIRTHLHALREALDLLPTSQQTREKHSLNSPFARCRRTHFARFNIIDNLVYNGRMRLDAIQAALSGADLLTPQKVDWLNTPYLFFAVDFDAESGEERHLDSYLGELWTTMRPEIIEVFQHCIGFDQVQDERSFTDYIKRCQVETTMPFNDYRWTTEPRAAPSRAEQLKHLVTGSTAGMVAAVAVAIGLPSLVLWLIGLGSPWGWVALVGMIAAVVGLYRAVLSLGPRLWVMTSAALAGLIAALAMVLRPFGPGGWPWGWLALAGLVVAVLALYRAVLSLGARPSPGEPDTDLPSILKAIYLQQHFVRFAARNQFADAAALHQAFGDFVAAHQPADLQGPTQEPGVIRS
jgi:hypothetical protein